MKKLTPSNVEYGILARMLRRVDFFSPLTVGQMEQILPYVGLFQYEPGERIFKQGETGDAFYIIHKGKVAVKVKQGFFSFARVVGELQPGEFFGEIALISDEPRTATVECLEPTQLFTIVSADFQSVLKSNPGAAEEMKRIAARRRFSTQQQTR